MGVCEQIVRLSQAVCTYSASLAGDAQALTRAGACYRAEETSRHLTLSARSLHRAGYPRPSRATRK